MSTAHQTYHVEDGIPTPDMTAYHVERAKGGVGLIILEAAAVHPSGLLTTNTIAGFDPRIVPAYAQLAEALHAYGTKVFSQLFHGGREIVSSSYRNAAWAPSAEPSLRFSVVPRPMSIEDIHEVIEGYAISAKLAKEGGLDGVEVCCSHGYLPAQFWSPHTNRRTDEYGGTFENRMRFIVEVIQRIWETVGDDFTVGIRMSADEKTMDGLTVKDALDIVEYLVEKVRIDFINVTSGDSSTYAGSTHIVPPSPVEHGYNAPAAFKIRMAGAVPVFVGSRIVDPAEAERIVAAGQADVVGMTRPLIVDPEMPNKARRGDIHLITACLGCNQACIGHYHKGLTIGCVQNPLAGKERKLRPLLERTSTKKRVVIVGAGPAGLQAAVTAAERGHDVIVLEQSETIGGLLQTMRRAPMRREVAESMLDNYTRRLEQSNVQLMLGTRASVETLTAMEADAIILAVGSRPYLPHVEGNHHPRLLTVDELFSKERPAIGHRVFVFDYLGDWPAIESAIELADKGHDVTLVTAKLHVGEEVHQYLRNEYFKRLYTLNVKMIPHHDFGGIRNEQAVMRNMFSHEETTVADWDTVVLSYGRVPNVELYESIKKAAPVVKQIGDCLAPRTLEEAVYEGYVAALEL